MEVPEHLIKRAEQAKRQAAEGGNARPWQPYTYRAGFDDGREAQKMVTEAERDQRIIELVEALQRRVCAWDDLEADHIEADRLLVAFIGDDRVTDAFDAIGKWYS